MSITMTSMPAPAWLRDLADARATYQELYGWPALVQVGPRRLVVATGRELAALTMPAALGAQVRSQLEISLLSAPIVAGADGRTWTFLARPAGPVRPSVAEDLAAAGVVVAPLDGHVVIPTALNGPAGPGESWVQNPRPLQALPPLHAVIAQVRRLTYHQIQVDRAA